MIDPKCPVCFGLGWVCENHPKQVWDDGGCECGAGMPCECQRLSLEGPDNPAVITQGGLQKRRRTPRRRELRCPVAR
jgi:hypothetical protein